MRQSREPEFCTTTTNLSEFELSQLNPFAQKSIYTEKKDGHPEEISFYSSGFLNDKNKILHSPFFRRLIHKRQLFVDKDDYFETRLTHTLELLQISQIIGKALRVNDDLIEAIVLGNDLGLTSFGHIGEKTLNDILTAKETLGGRIKDSAGGFNHNYQSIRLVDGMPICKDKGGLRLCWQVREGIWKHTKIRKKEDRIFDGSNNKPLLCNYSNFDYNGLYPDYDFSVTIEGQIVTRADGIVQRIHDIYDGLASGSFTIADIDGLGIFNLSDIRNADGRDHHIQHDLLQRITRYFVDGLIESSILNIRKYWSVPENVEEFENRHIITQRLVNFDEENWSEYGKLKCFLSSRLANKYGVKAIFLIKNIFKGFINKPRLLPAIVLRQINRGMEMMGLQSADISTTGKEESEWYIQLWQGNIPTVGPKLSQKEVNQYHTIFIRAVADYIAGMTDRQLNDVYKKLYLLE